MASPNRPKIMVATDMTPRSEAPFKRAIALAEQIDGEILAVHVVENDEDDSVVAEDRLAALAERHSAGTDITVDTFVIEGSVPNALAKVADDAKCAITVTGIARFNDVHDHYLGTAVDHLIRFSRVPVLVVKNVATEPYKRLLVATDLSSCSRYALNHAGKLFPDASIGILHAYHAAYRGLLTSDQITADVRAEAEHELENFLEDKSIPESVRTRVRADAMDGNLASVVDARLKKDDIDLVVLGTHGRSGFFHAIIGSRAAELLSWVPNDVLMVRERA